MMNWFRTPRPRLLFLSISLNLFFAALIGAAVAFGPMGKPTAPPHLRHIMRAAGPEAQPVIRQAMAAREKELKTAGKALRAARAELRAAVTAETVDPERLRQALSDRRMARAELGLLTDAAYVEIVAGLSLEERKKLAERRKRRPRKERRHDDGR